MSVSFPQTSKFLHQFFTQGLIMLGSEEKCGVRLILPYPVGRAPCRLGMPVLDAFKIVFFEFCMKKRFIWCIFCGCTRKLDNKSDFGHCGRGSISRPLPAPPAFGRALYRLSFWGTGTFGALKIVVYTFGVYIGVTGLSWKVLLHKNVPLTLPKY